MNRQPAVLVQAVIDSRNNLFDSYAAMCEGLLEYVTKQIASKNPIDPAHIVKVCRLNIELLTINSQYINEVLKK